jgi:hypothetical protein
VALFGKETEQDQQRAEAWGQWVAQRNPFAIASGVLGIFGLIEFGTIPVFGLGGLVLGIVALRQMRRPQPSRPRGHRLAWLGIVTSCLALLVGAALYMHRFMHS